jgi:hypothetical protein
MVSQIAFSSLQRPSATPVSNNALAIVHQAQMASLRNIDTPDNSLHRGK